PGARGTSGWNGRARIAPPPGAQTGPAGVAASTLRADPPAVLRLGGWARPDREVDSCSDLTLEFELGDGLAVHFIGPARQAQHAGVGPGGAQTEVTTDTGTAVRLNGPVDDPQGHVRSHHLDHGNRGPGCLVADRVHEERGLQGQEPCLLDLDARL